MTIGRHSNVEVLPLKHSLDKERLHTIIFRQQYKRPVPNYREEKEREEKEKKRVILAKTNIHISIGDGVIALLEFT